MIINIQIIIKMFAVIMIDVFNIYKLHKKYNNILIWLVYLKKF